MIKVDARGDVCPIPIVKTKNAIAELSGAGQVEVLVDNHTAVENLEKMAKQKQYQVESEQLEDGTYKVLFSIGEQTPGSAPQETAVCGCTPMADTAGAVCVISSSKMGEGSEELGSALMKAFIYALTKQETLPSCMLFYNGGVKLTCEDSPVLEDLKELEEQGVEIFSCGTCLNYYGLTEQLKIGSVINMYAIAEKMMQARIVVKP